jgi:hypothetical protein
MRSRRLASSSEYPVIGIFNSVFWRMGAFGRPVCQRLAIHIRKPLQLNKLRHT